MSELFEHFLIVEDPLLDQKVRLLCHFDEETFFNFEFYWDMEKDQVIVEYDTYSRNGVLYEGQQILYQIPNSYDLTISDVLSYFLYDSDYSLSFWITNNETDEIEVKEELGELGQTRLRDLYCSHIELRSSMYTFNGQ